MTEKAAVSGALSLSVLLAAFCAAAAGLPMPSTHADFAGVRLGDRMAGALEVLARDGYAPYVTPRTLDVSIECKTVVSNGYNIQPCQVDAVVLQKKDKAGNEYWVTLSFTQSPPPLRSSGTIHIPFPSQTARKLAASGVRDAFVAQIEGTIRLPYGASDERYVALALQKYPDLADTANYDDRLHVAKESSPRSEAGFRRFLFGSKDRCKLPDADYGWVYCLGVGVGNDGLGVAIGDARYADDVRRNLYGKLEDIVKDRDAKSAAPRF